MRPIQRGTTPKIGNIDKSVSDYKDWRQDLIDRIGNYCSYCNMTLNDSPQVEHVVPKNPQPNQTAGSMLSWDNMLLACGPCNRAKSNHPVSNTTHYLPDYHNTHLVFDFIIIDHPTKQNQKACIPFVNTQPFVDPVKARSTMDLFKLDKVVSNKRATDLRWKYRYEAYLSAQLWKRNWESWGYGKANEFIPLLVDCIASKGFFSIWFNSFFDVPQIKQAIISAFKGTNKNCFDKSNFEPLQIHLP